MSGRLNGLPFGKLWTTKVLCCILTVLEPWSIVRAQSDNQTLVQNLSQPSLEQLGNIPITSADNDSQPVLKTAAKQLIAYESGDRRQMSRRLYVNFAALAASFNDHQDPEGDGPTGVATPDNPLPLGPAFVLPDANAVEGQTIGTELSPVFDLTSWWRPRGGDWLLHISLTGMPGLLEVGKTGRLE
jgi:hypothetical protein